MTDKAITALVVVMASALLLTGGALTVLNDQETWGTGTLPTFEDQAQLDRFVHRSQGGGQWTAIANELAGDGASGQSVRHSTTNVQVQGVDEADSVKTDGIYLYIASGDVISIVKAHPLGELSNRSVIDLRDVLGLDANYSVWVQGIYLSGDRLVAVVSVCGPYPYHMDGGLPVTASSGQEGFAPAIWRMPEERSLVLVFSLDDGIPDLLGFKGSSGYPVTSRMIAGVVYLVSQHYLWMFGDEVSLPEAHEGSSSAPIPATSVRYDPECADPSSFLNILALDVSSLQSNHTSILTGYASTIYVSPEAMYLTFQKWDAADVPVQAMESSGDGSVGVTVSSDSATTTIYKLALEGLEVKALARGDVPGYLLNQFSLDEDEGLLRVATTFSWGNERSCVYVLNDELQVVGALEGLAPGERIYSCRFMGDTLYMVTFRQVDPLFVIDLSDPASPRVLGELKVPGFSSYLHPVGEGLLVGIGMDNGSVKLSLFDVSDPELPLELDTAVVGGWSYSEALWDHKAVTFDPLTGSLVIPVTSWDRGSWNCTSGAFVFAVGAGSVHLKGVVEPDAGECVMRAQYIEEHLYTITDTCVYVNSLDDLSPEARLVYRERPYALFPWLVAEGDVVAIGAFR